MYWGESEPKEIKKYGRDQSETVNRSYFYAKKWFRWRNRKDNHMEKNIITIQVLLSAAGAWISARLGILLPVLATLFCVMILDYITGMLASKKEAGDHPDDPAYGWSSKKGAQGIIKKAGYLCVVAAAMVVDYIILNVASAIGIQVPEQAFFGLLVAVWYVLNEILSIFENAGRMGAPVPEWLKKYIAVLKNKIDTKSTEEDE